MKKTTSHWYGKRDDLLIGDTYTMTGNFFLTDDNSETTQFTETFTFTVEHPDHQKPSFQADPSQINLMIGKTEEWSLPAVDANGGAASDISVVVSGATDADIGSELSIVKESALQYKLVFTYSSAASTGSGTMNIRV